MDACAVVNHLSVQDPWRASAISDNPERQFLCVPDFVLSFGLYINIYIYVFFRRCLLFQYPCCHRRGKYFLVCGSGGRLFLVGKRR